MRHPSFVGYSLLFRALALVCLIHGLPVSGASITTWNLEWFPAGFRNQTTAQEQNDRIQAAAAVLRELRSDIILVQEVQDLQAVEALAGAISPGTYQVAIVSRFKQGRGIGRQQLGILSTRPAIAAFAEEWVARGHVDPPRGFAFAAFDFDGRRVAVYAVHLKSNVPSFSIKDKAVAAQLNILQRELSALQLVQHIQDVSKTLGPFDEIVIGGDFNTNPDQPAFVSESTFETLAAAGFSNPLLDLPLAERITHPGKGRYPDATFDYLLIKGGGAVGRPSLHDTSVSDHRPLTLTVPPP